MSSTRADEFDWQGRLQGAAADFVIGLICHMKVKRCINALHMLGLAFTFGKLLVEWLGLLLQ